MTCTQTITAPRPEPRGAICDLGGCGTTTGALVAHGRLFLAEGLPATDLGLTSIVDLRPATEVTRRPLWVPGGVSYHHFPAVGSLERDAHTIAETLAFLTDPWAYPVLLHSAAGRVHASVVLAVVLGILGVANDGIAQDNDAEMIVRRYGSIDAYAAAIGVGSAAGYLRAALLA